MNSLEVVGEAINKGEEPPAGVALKPATVTLDSPDPNDIEVLIDGDTDKITVTSLLGGVMQGARVMVMFFPPNGAYITGVFGDAPWRDVAFDNEWDNYANIQKVQFRRDGRWVSLRGRASQTFAVNPAQLILTLPSGFRPLVLEQFATIGRNTSVGLFTQAQLDIDVDGTVTIYGPNVLSFDDATLSGIRFYAG